MRYQQLQENLNCNELNYAVVLYSSGEKTQRQGKQTSGRASATAGREAEAQAGAAGRRGRPRVRAGWAGWALGAGSLGRPGGVASPPFLRSERGPRPPVRRRAPQTFS